MKRSLFIFQYSSCKTAQPDMQKAVQVALLRHWRAQKKEADMAEAEGWGTSVKRQLLTTLLGTSIC